MSEHVHAVAAESIALIEEANAWVARLTSGTATVDDARALREWCARSAAHAQAYRNAARLWQQTGHPSVAARGKRAWQRYLRPALAASVLLIASIGLVLDRKDSDLHTGTAERRELRLEDGSTVVLDAHTRLRLDFDDQRRRVVLADGAAVFHVQHDANRPFVVEAENGSVTALGTVFEVRHRATGVSVTCTEGVVAVRQPGQPSRRVEAGHQVQYDARSSSPPRPVDSAEAMAWQRDLLVFRQRPLAELIEELNRYRPGHIVLASSEAANRPVSGVFHLQRTDEALEHIRASLGLTATYLPGDWVVLR